MTDEFDGPEAGDLDAAIPRGRRVLSLLAAIALLVGLAASWLGVSAISPLAGLAIMVGFAVSMALVFGCLMVRDPRHLVRWDLGVLVAGVALYALEHVSTVLPGYALGNDETFLGQDALRALLAGHNPYPMHFPDITTHFGLTPLLGGGVVTNYEYPPVTMELGWLLHHLWAPLAQPYVVATLALMALTVITFFSLPAEWRAVAVPLVLAFGLLNTYTADGYPVVVALPLLALVMARWTAMGARGRLGGRGVGQAMALGAAAATHQLAWIVGGLVVVALWVVRRGELDRAATVRVLGRYVGIAVLVFVVLDAPFIVADPTSWFHGITAVFRQHAVPFGVGLIMVTVAAVGHSGALSLFTYATGLLAVAILAIVLGGIRRVALAVPAFMGVLFLLSTRSTADYVIVFAPLWVVWAATADTAVIARSRPVGWDRAPVLTTAPRRAGAVALALLPALVVAVLGLTAPAPLQISAQRAVVARAQLVQVTIAVVNATDHAVRPTWFVDQRTHVASRWRVVRGPKTLRRGEHATVVLAPVSGPVAVRAHMTVYALSDGPAALSSSGLRLGAGEVTIPGGAVGQSGLDAQRCALRLLAGAGSC